MAYKDLEEEFYSHPLNVHYEREVEAHPTPDNGWMVHKTTGRSRVVIEGEDAKVRATLGKNWYSRLEKEMRK